MSFQAIREPAGSEVFSWTVEVESEQELVQIDELNAGVFYEEGVMAVGITATAAHDASGAAVPTTIEVIGPDVIELTVHHRAGNPAMGGAPFHYPIVAGVGWDGGFRTHIIDGPRNEDPRQVGDQPAPAPRPCVVPKLGSRSLSGARTRLASAGCKLGKVRGTRSKGARVVKQFRQPGAVLASGARVAVKLG